ncbi:MAG: hypothetical protein K6F94_01635 [Bacteroidaceae bacterium]|nr:hypothetical protein [Bacteroidaceae bacterium]
MGNKKNNIILWAQFAGYLFQVCLFVILCESGFLEHPFYIVSEETEYWIGVIAVLLTVTAIPLGLKFMTFPRIKEKAEVSEAAYLEYASIQMGLIGGTLILNTLIYYGIATGVTCGYLALISFVALLFISPKTRPSAEG